MQSGLALSEEWRENIQMSEQTFNKLCVLLRPFIEKETTRFRDPVSVETQIAATLYYLSDGGRMRKTANAFGLATPSISCIVRRVRQAISKELSNLYIKAPDTEKEVEEAVQGFLQNHGFPQCIGAVDGTHVPITKPKENATDFINRKGFFSLNVQACVDYKYMFFDTVIKWPGSVHDSRVFGNSSINQKLRDGVIPKCPKVIVDDEDPVPICILGDPAYPLLPYLMKEFAKGGNTESEQFFGYRLSSARMVVECAFGRLKSRFGILRKSIDLELSNAIHAIQACFFLHNFCEANCEKPFDRQTLGDTTRDEEIRNPAMQPVQEIHNNERGGKKYRRIFMKYFE